MEAQLLVERLAVFGYPLMFIGMVVEGPMVTAAAAFAASLGYFNVALVFLLSILGDVLPDVCYYTLGYFGHHAVIRRLVRLLRIREDRLDKARGFLSRHQLKGLALFKYVPFLAVTGLILTGTNKMPFKKFVLADTLIGIPHTLVFLGLGSFSGQAFAEAVRRVQHTELIFGVAVVFAALLYLLYRSVVRRITARLEKEAGLIQNGTP